MEIPERPDLNKLRMVASTAPIAEYIEYLESSARQCPSGHHFPGCIECDECDGEGIIAIGWEKCSDCDFGCVGTKKSDDTP